MVDVTTPPTMAAVSARRRWWARTRTSLFWIVIVAFAVRFGYIVIGHTYTFHSSNPVLAANEKDFSFGFEMGRIGRSLAQGQGFSNPFNETTGPTAWEPPLYPFLIAAVFKLCGIYTPASARILLSINSI